MLIITIYSLEFISSLVILKCGYKENISCHFRSYKSTHLKIMTVCNLIIRVFEKSD